MSGGWRNDSGLGISDDDDDGEENEEGGNDKALKRNSPGGKMGPGSNEFVNVIAPEDEDHKSPQVHPENTRAPKREAWRGGAPSVNPATTVQPQRQDSSTNSTDTFLTAEEEEELRIPGSFDMSNPRQRQGEDSDHGMDGDNEDEGSELDLSWMSLFKRLGLRS